jgi:hypothetical protein
MVRSLVFSILKVLVMLTMKPTKESTNIAQQLKYLRAYKYAFLQHEIVPILMTILVDPLSRKGSARTAQVRFTPCVHSSRSMKTLDVDLFSMFATIDDD